MVPGNPEFLHCHQNIYFNFGSRKMSAGAKGIGFSVNSVGLREHLNPRPASITNVVTLSLKPQGPFSHP